MGKPLNERIASALTNESIRSRHIETLIAEAEGERDRLTAAHASASAESVDFALGEDDREEAATKAGKYARSAEALSTALSGLRELLASRHASESAQAAESEKAAAVAERDEIAAEFAAFVPEALDRIIDLMGRVAKNEDQARALIAQRQAAISAGLDRRQRSPLAAYMGDLEESAENVGLAIEAIEVRALEDLNDGLADAIMGAESLGDVFSGVADSIIRDLLRIAIQQAVIRPLAESLGSSGGLLGSIGRAFTATLPGRASGGRVEGGQIYRINEGGAPGRVEAFRPDTGGNIIPLGQMGALQASGGKALSGVVRIVIEEEPGFVARVRTEASGAAVQVVRAAAPGMLGAASAQARRDAARPAMPGGMTG